MIEVFNTTKKNIGIKKLQRLIDEVVNEEKYFCEHVVAVYCGNKRIQKLNAMYLRHDEPTDTISFRLNEGKFIDGEFYISIDRVFENAKMYNQSFQKELSRVTIHSVLHLIGYNDKTHDEKKRMTEKENFYLQKIKFSMDMK